MCEGMNLNYNVCNVCRLNSDAGSSAAHGMYVNITNTHTLTWLLFLTCLFFYVCRPEPPHLSVGKFAPAGAGMLQAECHS